jgi:hypothetical protein
MMKAVQNSTGKMDTVMQGSVDRSRKAVWDLFGVGGNYKTTTKPAPQSGGPSVGSIITQNGHRYKVTAVENGKVTAADPVQ